MYGLSPFAVTTSTLCSSNKASKKVQTAMKLSKVSFPSSKSIRMSIKSWRRAKTMVLTAFAALEENEIKSFLPNNYL